jgi:dihydroorotate dehydrogenase electron transfer subunit
MKKTRSSEKKGVFIALVRDNVAIKGRFYRLSLQLDGVGALAFSQVIPGQFVEVSLSETALPPAENIPDNLLDSSQRQIILRRPFSFCDVEVTSQTDVRIEMLYCVLGPATLRMTTLARGDRLSIIGPLGNGFSIPDGKTQALLVAGGMGAPPLQHLARYLKANFPKMRVVVFAGAKSVADLPFSVQSFDKNSIEITEFAGFGAESHIATDDGSAGFRGFVTNCLSQWLKKNAPDADETIIYGCGPERMLAELAKLADEHNIQCQVSMERMMACGIGICQSCAVETKVQGGGETEYKLCCKDGPVFNSKDVVF